MGEHEHELIMERPNMHDFMQRDWGKSRRFMLIPFFQPAKMMRQVEEQVCMSGMLTTNIFAFSL